jgi:putative spermidine/putrescine transport system ATP-binding protein
VKAGDAAAAVGSRLSVSVRRDHVALRRGEATSGVNSIAGVVTATEYQGSYVKVTLDTAGGVFVANVSDRAYFAEHVDTGDKVVASWSTDDVHVLSKVDTGVAGDPYLDGGH